MFDTHSPVVRRTASAEDRDDAELRSLRSTRSARGEEVKALTGENRDLERKCDEIKARGVAAVERERAAKIETLEDLEGMVRGLTDEIKGVKRKAGELAEENEKLRKSGEELGELREKVCLLPPCALEKLPLPHAR